MVKWLKRYYFLLSSFLLIQANAYAVEAYNDAYFDSIEIKISSTTDSIPFVINDIIGKSRVKGDSMRVANGYYILGKYHIVRTYDYPTAYNYLNQALNIFMKLHAWHKIA